MNNNLQTTINNDIKKIELTKQNINNLQRFFKWLNWFLKGDNTTQIYIYVDKPQTIKTNLLNDQLETVTVEKFQHLLIEFLNGFADDVELYQDIIFNFVFEFEIIPFPTDLKETIIKSINNGSKVEKVSNPFKLSNKEPNQVKRINELYTAKKIYFYFWKTTKN